MKFDKKNIAIFLILLFHISGFIGICFTPYRNWFLTHTPLNLLVAFIGILVTISNKNSTFLFISGFIMLFGWSVEWVGVETGFPFGNYNYEKSILGKQLFGIPIFIGINWWLQVYCYGVLTEKYITKKNKVLKSTAAAFLMVISDFPMELLANKIGLWQWHSGVAPWQNYVGWLVYGFILQYICQYFDILRTNTVAIVYCFCTFLFFIGLNIFL